MVAVCCCRLSQQDGLASVNMHKVWTTVRTEVVRASWVLVHLWFCWCKCIATVSFLHHLEMQLVLNAVWS
jgi:hypothetical protein